MKNGVDLRDVIDQRKRNAQAAGATKPGGKARNAKEKKRQGDDGAGVAAAAGPATRQAQQQVDLPADGHVSGAQPAPQQEQLQPLEAADFSGVEMLAGGGITHEELMPFFEGHQEMLAAGPQHCDPIFPRYPEAPPPVGEIEEMLFR
jgi:hypothetical protein